VEGEVPLTDKKRNGKYTLHLVTAALAVGVCALYSQVLRNGFVFDDIPYLVENRHIQQGFTLSAIKWAFTAFYCANWHPLTWLSAMLDFRIFGPNPAGHHAVNVLLHAANTVLLLLVLRRMTGSLWRSAFVAALFAVHPLHVESVAWVAERKDVLSTLFLLTTIWAYADYAQSPNPRRYALVALTFTFGLMSKPMLVSVPILLLLLDFWPLRRLSLGNDAKKKRAMTVPKLIWEKTPLFALSAVSCVITYFAQQNIGAVVRLEKFPLGLRMANALVSYVAYIWKMIWPTGLAVYYPYPVHGIPALLTIGAALILIVISGFAIRAGKRHPYLAVGWLWYVISLVPVIGLVQVGEQSMADRYTYISLIGLFVMIAWGAPELLPRLVPVSPRLLVAPSLCVIAALSVCAWLQAPYWKSDYTLFFRTVSVTANNKLAHNNLGIQLEGQGKLDEAIVQYRKALEIDPDYADAHLDLGNALLAQGKVTEAVKEYSEVRRINPNDKKASVALANAMSRQGKGDLAATEYSRILESDPNNVDAHYNLGLELSKQGKFEEAASHYSKALEINPNYAKAHNNLGAVLAQMGRSDEAVPHYQEALRIKPDYPEAHYNLAMALAAQGKSDEAFNHLSEALKAKPDYAEAHNSLGALLAMHGRIAEAIPHFVEAVKYRPDYAEAHYNLGCALANQGKSNEAIGHYLEAIRIKPDYGVAHMNLAVELFISGRYAESWEEVHLSRRYGCAPNPEFLKALSAKMPER
jgi:tetratricopeptide (TPR) repeat protein